MVPSSKVELNYTISANRFLFCLSYIIPILIYLLYSLQNYSNFFFISSFFFSILCFFSYFSSSVKSSSDSNSSSTLLFAYLLNLSNIFFTNFFLIVWITLSYYNDSLDTFNNRSLLSTTPLTKLRY